MQGDVIALLILLLATLPPANPSPSASHDPEITRQLA